MQLVIELGLAPSLVALATLAGRRWGPRAGGLLSAFPAIVGPVLLIGALDHGRLFTARAANGTLLGLVALSAFTVAYGHGAVRWGWLASLLAGWTCAATAASIVELLTRGAGPPVGLLVAALSLGLAYLGMPRAPLDESPEPRRATWKHGSIPVRMALTALLVSSLAAAASGLGPVIGGMLAALPVLASILAVFTHRESGSAALIGMLRGMLAGMAGFIAFCQVILVLIVRHGTVPAFLAATAAALIAQTITIYLPATRRTSACAQPTRGVGPGVPSLDRPLH